MTTSRMQLAVRSAPLAVVLVGAVVLSGCGGPAATPSAPALAPTASAGPTPTATPTLTIAPTAPPTAPPSTQRFTSTLHGFSVSYPEGWTAEEATEPWTDGPHSHPFADPTADRLYDPTLTDHLFLTFASQPIGDSTPEAWIAEQMAERPECTATEPIAVDEAPGLIGSEGCDLAVVTTDGRGYWMSLRASKDDPSAVAPFDRAWFEEVLATVQLHPEDAVD
jgi:hypothetical protein